jgi:hypothetical protein
MPDPATWAGKPAPEPAAGAPLDMPQRGKPAAAPADAEDDVEADLKALFAIRDAAMAGEMGHQFAPTDKPDFEPTRPGEDTDPPMLPRL